MLVGVPKEIKNHEYRVGLTPSCVRELVNRGHQVLVECDAGSGIGLSNEQYQSCGAEIVNSAAQIFDRAEMIVKVKEPQPVECQMLSEGQILFTYLHLAADAEQTAMLIESGVIAIAYETVTDSRGALPLLSPMSEVAGRLSVQAGAHCLEKAQGGSGVLLAGVPGVAAAKVCVIGGGVVGLNAARLAIGMGADVTLLDRSLVRLKQIDELFNGRIKTLFSNSANLKDQLIQADLVIGAVLIPGAAAPKLVSRDNLKLMKPGSVLVDVAIDQGGCFETSRATSHDKPIYEVDNIVHYCVANMPGAVARTSTFALTNVTFPYVQALADHGVAALSDDINLCAGLNVYKGQVTCEAVAEALDYAYINPVRALNIDLVCSSLIRP